MQNALDARRQRIIISESTINWVKWAVVYLLAVLILLTIAIVHSDNRATAGTAMAIFSVAVAASIVLIASHSRPFTGEISVGPGLLLQVMPEEKP
jgi:membrane protein YdbS with pleckstrin-like domain